VLAAAHERIRQLSEENPQLMRKSRTSASNVPGERDGRLLLHLGPGLRQAIESDDVYFVEAAGDDTVVRTRSARVIKDVRPIGALEAPFLRRGFLRTHRNYLVNPRHVRQVRRRPQGEDWELTLAPPVNVVLPVSRSALVALWAAFGEE
jgi:DNA-binding LytR/AlgR family response regulator